jgi:hypothetical protein
MIYDKSPNSPLSSFSSKSSSILIVEASFGCICTAGADDLNPSSRSPKSSSSSSSSLSSSS